MWNTRYISITLAIAMLVMHAPSEVHAEEIQFTKTDELQALLSLVIPEPSLETQKAALAGKKALTGLIKGNDKHAQELGFHSAAEAADTNTHLGRPFPFIIVDAEKLKIFRLGVDPLSLLIPIPRFLYPITVNGSPLSSLTVIQVSSVSDTRKAWRTIGWGAPKLIQSIAAAQKSSQASASSFVVRIEELSRYFLADFKNGKFFIIPLLNEKKYDFVAGVPVQADQAFWRLVPEIQNLLKNLESKY